MLNAKRPRGRRSPSKNVTTRSGKSIKINHSLVDRVRASKDERARRKALYMSKLPKNPFKRILYKLHPKRLAAYWFSREGALMALKVTGIGIVVFFVLMVGVFAYFRKDLPKLTGISGSQLGGSITYYDRTGQTVLWQDYDAVKRLPVEGNQISPFMKQATVAIEDKNFFKHGAFDVQGILRAVVKDVTKSGGPAEGGSTITQQLVKLNQNWTNDHTITRKFKELILAVEVEREYSKDEILTGYLNIAPYGNVQYGVESASRDYFGKSAKDLTLAESAMLAAIPQAPSFYSPYGPIYDSGALIGRQHYILDQMLKQKMITKTQADDAKKVDILAEIHPVQAKYQGIKAPYFVLAAKQQLEEKYGSATVQRGGWKVTTTLDMNLQTLAEDQVAKGMGQIRKQGGDAAAFAAIDVETAQMVALVGGPDFSNPVYGQVNFAKEKLPPGSSFKPYDYATLIDNTNTGAGSVIYDTKGALPGYPCTNQNLPKNGGNCLYDYDFRFPGPVTLRYALGGSRNIPAIKAMLMADGGNGQGVGGINKTIATAEGLGLKSGYKCYLDDALTKETQCYASSAIGDGAYLHLDEHVNGYASLSRMGAYIPETYILKITDARGKTIDEWKPSKPVQVVKPDTAFILTDMMSDPNASYLPGSYKFHRYNGWHFGIKTGTTNDGKDGLMMSVSTKYAAGVWVGYHNRQRVMSGAMEYMTEPIIKGWMQGAHNGLAAVNWTRPSGVQTLPAFVITSKLSSLGEVIPSPGSDIFPSWYKQPSKQAGTKTYDKVSNKIATDCTPDAAKEVRGANDNIFSVDIFAGRAAGGTSTDQQDDVHKCTDQKPSVSLTSNGADASGVYSFTVTVSQGTFPLSSDKFPGSVGLYVNGQLVQSQAVSGSPTTVTFNYTPTSAGTITVEARVTDSVLYTASDTTTVDVKVGGNSQPTTTAQAHTQNQNTE